MNPKHTPGPWAIGLETDDVDAQIINAKGQHVAKVSIDPLMPTASLISAAPELLSTLTMLVGKFRKIERGMFKGAYSLGNATAAEVDAARAVIKKATT